MKNMIQCLRHIREMGSHASTKSIMELFNVSKEHANELIDYLYEEGYIHKPITVASGDRLRLKVTSYGMNLITNPT